MNNPIIVGLGASAGGLEAFRSFFDAMPPNSGMAFVLIQHLAPDKKSLLAELLRRHTCMEVVEAEQDMGVLANRLYVIPPDATLTIKQGRLRLERPAPERCRRWPIDAFFTSLAADQGERAVCIILAGGGSDGALGLKSVKEHGGFTLAQAVHDSEALQGMPRSAHATGHVDFVMPVEEMPAKLLQYQQHLNEVDRHKMPDGTRGDMANYVEQICTLVKSRTGHDFSQYKTKTLIRRIQRRMQLVQIDAAPNYIRLLRKDPRESQLLVRDLLINVTQFFRDGASFEALEGTIIPKLIERTGLDDTLRVWVPGCASGEEAYSVAILLKEGMSKLDTTRKVQIFATDLDDEAVRAARAARFPSTIAADMPRERFERWFVEDPDHSCPRKSIREMCIFSVHDLLKDPPFSKLDLISCRNLFIYFNAALQVGLLEAFHYALRPGGYLFLGSSEGISRQGRLFESVEKKHRIFQRRDVNAPLPGYPLADRAQKKPAAPVGRAAGGPDSSDRLWREVLTQIAPACVVVNGNDEIVRYFGQTGRYLEPSPGAASLNLFTVLRPELRQPTRALLHEVREHGQRRTQSHVSIPVNGSHQFVTLIVAPVAAETQVQGDAVVAFQENGPPVAAEQSRQAQAESAAEQEVRTLRQQLSATSADLEAANEDLKSANEEYQSVNEELQSTNEELETAKEELQSTNEELQTVNAELTAKNEDLTRLNSDMRNFFDSTDIASLFLDGDLRIRTFTPAMRDLINIRDSDRGRPISDLTGQLIYGDVDTDVKRVIRTLSPNEREVGTKDGMRFMMRIRPYRSVDNVIDGVVMTFVDITGRRRAGAASEQLDLVIEEGFGEVLVCDMETLRFCNANRTARENLGYSMDELRRLTPPDIEATSSASVYKEKIDRLRSEPRQSSSFNTHHRRKDGSQYPVEVRFVRVIDPPLIVVNARAIDDKGRH